ncbi:uncharacterized protein BYT42DRAFT_614646 [Radiomyces spectabilis]|uniref:uncharacterized protein n=1 Tax=Radiomyces spectabilis TaxID=64574 RepID=UPI00221F4628|nr:uncharacterized protein BYT42DRAFT_614646 [Radiomyces spectabilis]KAI8378016.1 hypothetical protein BYT42DRAFT_614646 [Radiomyces spectabilis]
MSQPVEAIERTAEYEDFMRQLKEFHDRKGTFLQTEPVLGGKKLDLLKIYKTVIEAGGYDKVTQNRGWKQVGDPFNFPPTCTNSAYVLKSIYTRSLLGWEEEHYWKRPWNPPSDLVEQKTHNKVASSSPLNIAVKQRDTARQTATAFIQPSYNTNVPNMRIQQLPPQPPIFQPPMPAMMNPYVPAVFMDEEFRTRILLALKSCLPNEIDWAFNTLVKFSYASENFSLDFMPVLVDLLLGFTDPFFEKHIEPAVANPKSPGEIDPVIFSSKKDQEMLERVLQVFHILRNFSFLEINIRRLAHHEKLRHLLMLGIALPPSSPYVELTRHCLDILENIAPQVTVSSPNDSYLTVMTYLLFTNDRALILGSIRSLTRVAVTEFNERVLGIANSAIIGRMAQFLLLDDEELAAATLEYLYQYSGLRGNFAAQLVKEYPGNLIGLLTGYLSYKSTLLPPSGSLTGTIHGIPAVQANHVPVPSKPQAPTIPDLTNYAHLDEPYRCLGWLREKFVSGSADDTFVLKDIYGLYRDLFGAEKPLGVKEFYTVLKIAHPQPASTEANMANGSVALQDVTLHNMKNAPTKPPEVVRCRWRDCGETFESEADLHQHIVSRHVRPNEAEEYECHWINCKKRRLPNRAALMAHLRIHFAPKATAHSKKPHYPDALHMPIDDSEVSGVPLTAALLLRNLVRHKQHHIHYLPYENELMLLAIQRPKLSKYILTVLAELQVTPA